MSNTASLPFRQIHLDFHTSEHIPGVGADFDPEKFAATLKASHVDSVTLFAKCHHGWSYYPTKVGQPHPHLEVPDLLGEMIRACRKVNIQTPVYITVQWDERTAREHPEWRVLRAKHGQFQSSGHSGGDADLNQLDAQWHPLSVIHDELVGRIIRQSLEVIEAYDPPGLFMDILLPWQDVSEKNLERMAARGLDPEQEAHRLQNDREVILDYYKRFANAIHAVSPTTRIFHNSGHIYKGERDRWEHFSHLELESLPTGGWGYDHFPVSARYASQLGLPFLGMTGKFHTSWGEFGGYKTATAIEFECMQMAALGARCSIGDQLHPTGKIDASTYARIAPAYKRLKTIEPFLIDAQPVAEIGIISAEAHRQCRDAEPSDIGAARTLLESQQMFEILDWESDFSKFRLLILPDQIRLDATQAKRIKEYLNNGGKVLSTGTSLLADNSEQFAIPCGAEYLGMREFHPDYIAPTPLLEGPYDSIEQPFVVYKRGIAMRCSDGIPLALLHDPYFNRSWKHFCSHQHSPARPQPNGTHVAAIRKDSLIHFAHPLFADYHQSGQPLTKNCLLNAIRRLLPTPTFQSNLPTSARVSWMRQPSLNRDILHLLFAQTQLRGTGLPGWNGLQQMEIIEDATPLFDVRISIETTRPVKSIHSVYKSSADCVLNSRYNDPNSPTYAYEIAIPKLSIHEALVLNHD